jgi:hypothetical protein
VPRELRGLANDCPIDGGHRLRAWFLENRHGCRAAPIVAGKLAGWQAEKLEAGLSAGGTLAMGGESYRSATRQRCFPGRVFHPRARRCSLPSSKCLGDEPWRCAKYSRRSRGGLTPRRSERGNQYCHASAERRSVEAWPHV